MGARSVVAPGRNEAVLSDLKRRFGDRLVPVRLVGDADYDSEAMKHAAPAPIDAVLDFLPPSAKARVARRAIMTVRPYLWPSRADGGRRHAGRRGSPSTLRMDYAQ
jgi:alcohol dehydrogenase